MSSHDFEMTAPPEVYRNRRARLAAGLTRPVVVFAGRARARQYATNLHAFRAGSNYLYFGGPPLEGAALWLDPGSDGAAGCKLIRTVCTLDDAVWLGEPPGDDAIAAAAGLPVSALGEPDQLPTLLRGRKGGYFAPPCPPTVQWAASLGLSAAEPEECAAVIELRLLKDEHERRAMRRAAAASVEAHLAAMRACKPGAHEAEVAAALLATMTAQRCIPSFTPIVSVRGEVFHNEKYVNVLRGGDLLLVDSGAEEGGGYASDITRTYPVGGVWSDIQRQIYDTVLLAQREAIRACVPGRRFREVHDLAAGVVCEGLVRAGLLRGDPVELAARRVHTLFFAHGLGHLIGLDVHDMEDFGDLAGYAPGRSRRSGFGDKFLRLDRDLAPGMALTVEPGVYFVPVIWQNREMTAPFADCINRPLVDSLVAARFGGIRIEETIIVNPASADGPEVLTAALPNDAEAVSAIVGRG